MKLISLKINKRNNSGWESEEVAFGAHITQVTGENGSGKTPIIQAIVFCLGFPVTFRDDVKAQCRSVSLVIEARNDRYLIERAIEAETKITVSSNNSLREFCDEREYSEFVFSLIGLDPVNLLDTSNRKTVPYMATALPLFFLDQDNGEVPPLNSAAGNLVESVFEKENGLEEAVFRGTDHWLSEAGGSRRAGDGIVSAVWVQ